MSAVNPTALADLDARTLSARYQTGELTPSEVIESVLARVAEREPELNALAYFDAEQVRRDADESTKRWLAGSPLSPFDGVPGTVKENVARAGVPKPGGTAIPNPPVPVRNAPIADRLLEAGMVIVGSTTMPDWGMLSSGVSSLHGITRNALNPAHTSGGSSAGAGTAAAAGYGPWHVGTDIGGSIRLPGTWQGLVALKPSNGLIPLDGPYTGRAAGPLTKRVTDAVDMMSILAKWDARDYLSRPYPPIEWSNVPVAPAGLRVAVQLDAGSGLAVEPETQAAVLQLAELFARSGAEVEELQPFMASELLDACVDFWRSRSWADFEVLTPAEQECVLPFISEWCRAGKDFSAAQTVRNRQAQDEIARVTRYATEPFDVVLSPVSPVAAFPAENPMPLTDPLVTMGHISFTMPYNMSGQPALSMPTAQMPDGRTIGVQVAGRIGTDAWLLQLASWIEEQLA